jgi:HK97 family phage major capsid protein
MNLTKARELREERARLYKEARDLYDGSTQTKEDIAKFNAAMDKCDELKAQIDAEERADATDKELRAGAPPRGKVDGQLTDDDVESRVAEYRRVEKREGRNALKSLNTDTRATVEQLNSEYWGAMTQYLLNGDANLSPEARAILNGRRAGFRALGVGSIRNVAEYRDMSTGGGNALQGAGGGYFVPVGFVNEVEEGMKWYGDMLRSSTIMRTATGQPLPWPTDNDTSSTGEQVGEATQVSEGDLSLGNIVFGAYKFSTKMVKVSIEMLQDSAFDLESFCVDKFGIRLGRIINTKSTTGAGSGSTTLNGILTAATAGPTATGSATNDGGSETGGTSIGTDDLIELEHSVDKAYRRDSAYMAHDTTIKLLKKLKDKYGRPLWVPGIAVNAPDTINGYPYFTNNDLPTVAVNAKTVLFGALKKYVIREVKELAVLRLNERFADYGQVAFIGFARYDGNLLDAGTHPVKYLVQAAA